MPRKPTRALAPMAAAIATLVLFAALAAHAAELARAEPRFGDSTWVAPNVVIQGTVTDPGPRVAKRDSERGWETAMRAPFRVAFFPVRLVARGIEALGPLAEKIAPPGDLFRQARPKGRGLKFSPELLGATVTAPEFAGPGSKAALTGTWSLTDARKLKFRGYVGDRVSDVGAGFAALYERKPARNFYGIGNASSPDKTIYLQRTELGDVYAFAGRNQLRRLRATLGIEDMDVGPGYNGSGSPKAVNVFDPDDVPFLNRGSRVWWYGASANLAALDDSLQPSSGIHFMPDVRRYQSNDGTNVRYDQWRLEGRGYLPVFAKRRVLAARVVYEGVDRRPGSGPIPFYRLPNSTDADAFAAFHSGRFRDNRLALGRLEYRWEIEPPVDAFLLGELGEVAPNTGALALRSAHTSLGGGLRAKIGELQAVRLELAHGHEGLVIRANLSAEF